MNSTKCQIILLNIGPTTFNCSSTGSRKLVLSAINHAKMPVEGRLRG